MNSSNALFVLEKTAKHYPRRISDLESRIKNFIYDVGGIPVVNVRITLSLNWSRVREIALDPDGLPIPASAYVSFQVISDVYSECVDELNACKVNSARAFDLWRQHETAAYPDYRRAGLLLKEYVLERIDADQWEIIDNKFTRITKETQK